MNVIEAIRTKRAVRRYRDEPLPDDIVRAILTRGRRTAAGPQGGQAATGRCRVVGAVVSARASIEAGRDRRVSRRGASR